MSRAEIEQLDDRGMAAWDQHDAAAFTALLADGFTFSDVMSPEAFTTREQVQAYMESWFTAFPDMRAKATNRVVSDDQVAGEVEITGTHTGPLQMGGQEIPATGKPIVGTGTYFGSVRDGKFVSFRVHPNVASMMMQLGLMPGASSPA
jgi:steroid delta-isomerase-like uncharacterized protein